MWPTLLPLLGNLMDKLFPNPQAAADAKLKLMELAQAGELAQLDADTKLAVGQMGVNQVEAASSSMFVAGWRPFVGWVCGGALAFKFVIAPLLAFGFAAYGHPVALPVLDFSEMSTILLGMLGLGALRTAEKIKGVA